MDIKKFQEAFNLVGYEVDFTVRDKIRRALIVAVSIPGMTTTVYPHGEMNEYYKKEFATIYSNAPYWVNLSILGRNDFWTKQIENLDLKNPIKVDDSFVRFENIEKAKEIFLG